MEAGSGEAIRSEEPCKPSVVGCGALNGIINSIGLWVSGVQQPLCFCQRSLEPSFRFVFAGMRRSLSQDRRCVTNASLRSLGVEIYALGASALLRRGKGAGRGQRRFGPVRRSTLWLLGLGCSWTSFPLGGGWRRTARWFCPRRAARSMSLSSPRSLCATWGQRHMMPTRRSPEARSGSPSLCISTPERPLGASPRSSAHSAMRCDAALAQAAHPHRHAARRFPEGAWRAGGLGPVGAEGRPVHRHGVRLPRQAGRQA